MKNAKTVKPGIGARKPKIHSFQIDIDRDDFLAFKGHVIAHGESLRLNITNHIRKTIGKPPLAKDELEPSRMYDKKTAKPRG